MAMVNGYFHFSFKYLCDLFNKYTPHKVIAAVGNRIAFVFRAIFFREKEKSRMPNFRMLS